MSGLLGRGARLAAQRSLSRTTPSPALPRRSLAVASPGSLPGAAQQEVNGPFVKIVEVSPRDGLQNEKAAVSVETKVELIRRLQDAGVCAIEAGSFVSPKWVPQMADTARVLTSMPLKSGISYPVLVPNARGLDDLLSLLDSHPNQPLTDEIAIFTAATESFTRKNTNVSITESLDRLSAVTQKAKAKGLKVRGYISVVAGCPYEGAVDAKVVGDISSKLFQMGCYEVSLGDTVGVGNPSSMLSVLNECARFNPPDFFAAHCHDTFGTGLANVLAMVGAGVRVVDTAVGGLGGCPYSPGATGNIDTESVVYALHSEGFNTGIDLVKAAEAGEWIAQAVGKGNNSSAGRALLARQRMAGKQQVRGYHTRTGRAASSPVEGIRSASSSSRRDASAVTHNQPGPTPPPPTIPADSSPPQVLRHPSVPDLEIALHPTSISITCPSHSINEAFELDHTWLRDVCPEVGSSIQAGTGQKLFGTTDVPLAENGAGLLDPEHPPRFEEGANEEPVLVLTYSTSAPVLNAFSTTFSPSPPQLPKEAHVSRVPLRTLLLHASETLYRSEWHLDPAGVAEPWVAADLTKLPAGKKGEKPAAAGEVQPTNLDEGLAQSRPAMVDYGALYPQAPHARQALWSLANSLVRDGLTFVRGLPTDVKSGTSLEGERVPELAKLADMLGEVRNTFYGPLWDVRSLPAKESRNIAYTNVDLGLHMDLLYFQNPPRFQFLHMLRNDVLGGSSIFVDSFAIAARIHAESPETFHLLTQVPIAYQYDNDGNYYRYTHPLFELSSAGGQGHEGPPLHAANGAKGNGMPRLVAVNYSPPFQAPLPLVAHPLLRDPTTRARFYSGLKRFADLTLLPEFRVERQLEEGEVVLFDNRRVLHSRKGFEFTETGGEGEEKYKRWLKGCYVDGDAIWSRWRVVERERRARLQQEKK